MTFNIKTNIKKIKIQHESDKIQYYVLRFNCVVKQNFIYLFFPSQ